MQNQDLFSNNSSSGFSNLNIGKGGKERYPVQVGDYCRVFFHPEQRTVEGIVVSYLPRNHRYFSLITLEGKLLKCMAYTAKKIDISSLKNKKKEEWAREQSAKLAPKETAIDKYLKQKMQVVRSDKNLPAA
jgi:hypothetical protein